MKQAPIKPKVYSVDLTETDMRVVADYLTAALAIEGPKTPRLGIRAYRERAAGIANYFKALLDFEGRPA
jgi:hypothetical protein